MATMTSGYAAGKAPGSLQPADRVALALLFLASLWLSQAIPVFAIPGAAHDDGLFVDTARNLLAGRWLGPFDDRTLIKGMLYPLFIAVSHVAGVPLKLAEHLAYLGAGLLLAVTVGRIVGGRIVVILLFAAIAFNPAEWMTGMARALRDCLSVSEATALVAVAAWAFVVAEAEPLRRRVGWLAALGLLLGAFWLTREDREWILAPIGVLAGYGVLCRVRRPATAAGRGRPSRILAEAGPLLLPLAIATAMVGTVAALNDRAYGVFRDNDIRSSAFQGALAALRRVEPNPFRHYVVIPRPARERAYGASPALAELRPYLEGDMGATWRRFSCPIWPSALGPCSEASTMWFIFELRQAVAAAGHYRSGRDADAYYRRLSREIDEACASGRIECLPPRPSLMLPVYASDLPDSLSAALQVYRSFAGFADDSIGVPASMGMPDDIAGFLRITGGMAEPGAEGGGVTVKGWVYSKAGPPTLSVGGLAASGQATLTVSPAPDVLAAFPAEGAEALRFTVGGACGNGACQLRISRDGSPDVVHSLADPRPGRQALDRSDLILYLDVVDKREAAPGESHRLRALQLAMMRGIAAVYRTALPLALPAALLVLAAVLFVGRRGRRIDGPEVLAIALLAGVAGRIAFLGYFYVAMQPVIEPRYLAPVYPIAFALVATVAAIAARRLGRGPPAPEG
jgi:hypothetical protein